MNNTKATKATGKLRTYSSLLLMLVTVITFISCDEKKSSTEGSREFVTQADTQAGSFNLKSLNEDLEKMEGRLEKNYGIQFLYSGGSFSKINFPDLQTSTANTWFEKNRMFNDAFSYFLNYEVLVAYESQNKIKDQDVKLARDIKNKTTTMGKLVSGLWHEFLIKSISNLNSSVNGLKVVEVSNFRSLSLNMVVNFQPGQISKEKLLKVSKKAVQTCEGLIKLKSKSSRLEELGFIDSDQLTNCSKKIKVEFLASMYEDLLEGKSVYKADLNAVHSKISQWDEIANTYLFENGIILDPTSVVGYRVSEIKTLKDTLKRQHPGLNSTTYDALVHNNMYENLRFKLDLVEARLKYLPNYPDPNSYNINRNVKDLILFTMSNLSPYEHTLLLRGGTSPFDEDSVLAQ